MNYIIASFPRSGNHWVRYIVEWFSKRPTIGDGKRDLPIYKKVGLKGISGKPIAKKRHRIDESMHDKKLLLIVRNFMENKDIIDHQTIDYEAHKYHLPDVYMGLIEQYDVWPEDKIILYYEDLMDDPFESIMSILEFFKIDSDNVLNFINDIDIHRHNMMSYYMSFMGIRSRTELTEEAANRAVEYKDYIINNYPELSKKYLSRYY